MAKETTTKTAAKRAAAKKAVKPVATKKAPAKKVAKKAAPRKAATKNAAPSPAKDKVEKTTIIARVDVGFGNSLYIRGEGAGLSWDKGAPLENVGPYEWTWSSTQAKGDLSFKFLINDEMWAEGNNVTVAKGGTSISSPVFAW
jgi:hypothetical protein